MAGAVKKYRLQAPEMNLLHHTNSLNTWRCTLRLLPARTPAAARKNSGGGKKYRPRCERPAFFTNLYLLLRDVHEALFIKDKVPITGCHDFRFPDCSQKILDFVVGRKILVLPCT